LNQIKVLIIDDSHVIHILLEKVISFHEEITVIGNAYDGKEGVDLVKKLSPDVIIMDIGMPRMNGLEAIQEIMNDKPTPIIVFSSSSKNIVDLGFQAIELGAVHMVEKPSVSDLSLLKDSIEESLIKAIKTFADFKVIRRMKKKTLTSQDNELLVLKDSSKILKTRKSLITKEIDLDKNYFPIIGIAASTGGPQTIKSLIEDFSTKQVNTAVIIVQHMAEGFMQGFSDWLATYSLIPVVMPQNGDTIKPNNIYVAPGEYHLIFSKEGYFSFLNSPPIQGIRPSADLMFSSLGETFKERVIAVILTGMGSDGTQGLQKVKENNGYIISQDEESSLIFGMPKSAIEAGLVNKILNITEIPGYLEKLCNDWFKVRQ